MEPRRKLVLLSAVGLASALLAALSIPSTIAAFTALPHQPVLDAIHSGKGAAQEDARAMVSAMQRAAGWFEGGRYHSAAASGLLALATPESFAAAETEIRQALQMQPASAFDWLRLAFLRFRKGDRAGAKSAWRLSVLTGRIAPGIMQTRTALGLALIDEKDTGFEREVVNQIQIFANAMPRELAIAARKAGVEPAIRFALAEDPQARKRFDEESRILTMIAVQKLRTGK